MISIIGCALTEFSAIMKRSTLSLIFTGSDSQKISIQFVIKDIEPNELEVYCQLIRIWCVYTERQQMLLKTRVEVRTLISHGQSETKTVVNL